MWFQLVTTTGTFIPYHGSDGDERPEGVRMEDEGRKYWLSVAAFVVVFVAVIITFSMFMQQTSNRIVSQSSQYVSDATDQTAKLVKMGES